ncbi:MAG TPA: T9SS type A sorting domain-containing protein, partial [Cyclobacteriaceae bacterium]
WHYFNGYYADGQAFVEWHTASEINNEGFEVEHSTDGTDFVKIGWVAGHGTTNVANQYQFIHDHPDQGWNYYRLKQIDYDGKFEYSRLIPVFADDLPRVEIYPNPFRDHIYLSRINTDENIQVTLTNALGQDPIVLLQDPMQPARFNLPRRLEPGVYHARVQLGNVIHTRKVIIE